MSDYRKMMSNKRRNRERIVKDCRLTRKNADYIIKKYSIKKYSIKKYSIKKYSRKRRKRVKRSEGTKELFISKGI